MFMGTAYAVDIPNSGDDGNAHWTWDETTKTITVTAKDNTDGVMTRSGLPTREKGGHINFGTSNNNYGWRVYHLPEAEHIKFVQNAQGIPVTIQMKEHLDNQIIPQRFFGEDLTKIGKFYENKYKAAQLKTADLTGLKFDVATLAADKYMVYNNFFGNCANLEEVILSEHAFGNNHLKSHYQMFVNCSKLKHIYGATYDKQNNTWAVDKSEDTSGLKYINDANTVSTVSMFEGCESLQSLDVSLFPNKLSSPQYVHRMFLNCTGLEKLNLKGVTFKNGESFFAMFANCNHISELDVSSFDTSNCGSMKQMFFHCWLIKKLDLSNFKTQNVTDMASMFQYSNNLEELTVPFDTSKVKTMESMFSGVINENPSAPNTGNFELKKLDLSTFDTHNCTNFNNMLSGLRALETLKFGDKFATNGESQAMVNTFAGDTALKELTVGKEFAFTKGCALPEPNYGKAKWARKGKELTSPTWTSKQLTGTKTTKSIYKPNAAADSDDSVISGTIVAVAALWNLTLDTDGGTIENLDAYQPCNTTLCKHQNNSNVWAIREGATVKELPVPTKKGYAFRGWVSSDTDSNIMRLWFFDTKDHKDKASIMQRDTTLTALWEKEDTSSKHNQPSGGTPLPSVNPETPTTPKPDNHTPSETPQKENTCPSNPQTTDTHAQQGEATQKNITIINNYGRDNSTITFGAQGKNENSIALKGESTSTHSNLPGTGDNAGMALLVSMLLIGSAAGLTTSTLRKRARKHQKLLKAPKGRVA